MIFPNSRYAKLCDNQLNQTVPPRQISLPEGMVEHVVGIEDRLDLLAYQYYGDARLWWHILDANPQIPSAFEFNSHQFVDQTILIPPYTH